MNTTFLISGGAGRVICAIPALETYHKSKPDDNFKVLVYGGWENLYYSHPILQERTYNADMKGVFDLIIKNSNLIHPEPYHYHRYYNGKCSMVDAFQELINGVSSEKSPMLYLHSNEIKTAKLMINQAKERFKKKRFIVFQPYGSGVRIVDGKRIDSTGRSLNEFAYEQIAAVLANELDAVVLYFGNIGFNTIHNENVVITAEKVPNADLRFYMSMILNCDYFVGVDSVGQHMAKAFNVPGTVIMGSTLEKNVTYPTWFNIYRKPGVYPSYNPIRISPNGSELIERVNDGIMDFSYAQLDDICQIIKQGICGKHKENVNGK